MSLEGRVIHTQSNSQIDNQHTPVSCQIEECIIGALFFFFFFFEASPPMLECFKPMPSYSVDPLPEPLPGPPLDSISESSESESESTSSGYGQNWHHTAVDQ